MARRGILWAWTASVAAHVVGMTALLHLHAPGSSDTRSPMPVMELALMGGPEGGNGPKASSPDVAAGPAVAAPSPRPVDVPPPTPVVRTPPRPVPSVRPARAVRPAPPVPASRPAAKSVPSESVPASNETAASAGSELSRGGAAGTGGAGSGGGSGTGDAHGDGTGRGGSGSGTGAATPPSPLARVQPEYPSAARTAGVEGQVVLRAMVDTDGLIQPPVQVVRSIPALDAAAIDALRRWKFRPARDADGQAVRVVVDVPIRFQLQ